MAIRIAAICCIVLFALGCTSGPQVQVEASGEGTLESSDSLQPGRSPEDDARSESTAGTATEGRSGERNSDGSAQELMQQALAAIDLGEYTQAMTLYLRVLEGSPGSSEAAVAEAELERFGSGLRMSAGDAWLDAGGRQGPQEAMALVTQGGPLPTVQLTYTDGPARFTVASMPIEFAVVGGKARFQPVVVSSDFGAATSSALSLTAGEEPIVVEAIPVVISGDARYPFEAAAVRFVYDPPATPAVLVNALIEGGEVAPASILADALLPSIEETVGSATILSASMLGAQAGPLLRGSARSVRDLAQEMDTPVVIVAAAELERISQIQYEGRDYNIFQAIGRVRVEIRGITGGQVLYQFASEELKGQGGSDEAARLDLLELAAQQIEDQRDAVTEGMKAALQIDLE